MYSMNGLYYRARVDAVKPERKEAKVHTMEEEREKSGKRERERERGGGRDGRGEEREIEVNYSDYNIWHVPNLYRCFS